MTFDFLGISNVASRQFDQIRAVRVHKPDEFDARSMPLVDNPIESLHVGNVAMRARSTSLVVMKLYDGAGAVNAQNAARLRRRQRPTNFLKH